MVNVLSSLLNNVFLVRSLLIIILRLAGSLESGGAGAGGSRRLGAASRASCRLAARPPRAPLPLGEAGPDFLLLFGLLVFKFW